MTFGNITQLVLCSCFQVAEEMPIAKDEEQGPGPTEAALATTPLEDTFSYIRKCFQATRTNLINSWLQCSPLFSFQTMTIKPSIFLSLHVVFLCLEFSFHSSSLSTSMPVYNIPSSYSSVQASRYGFCDPQAECVSI